MQWLVTNLFASGEMASSKRIRIPSDTESIIAFVDGLPSDFDF